MKYKDILPWRKGSVFVGIDYSRLPDRFDRDALVRAIEMADVEISQLRSFATELMEEYLDAALGVRAGQVAASDVASGFCFDENERDVAPFKADTRVRGSIVDGVVKVNGEFLTSRVSVPRNELSDEDLKKIDETSNYIQKLMGPAPAGEVASAWFDEADDVNRRYVDYSKVFGQGDAKAVHVYYGGREGGKSHAIGKVLEYVKRKVDEGFLKPPTTVHDMLKTQTNGPVTLESIKRLEVAQGLAEARRFADKMAFVGRQWDDHPWRLGLKNDESGKEVMARFDSDKESMVRFISGVNDEEIDTPEKAAIYVTERVITPVYGHAVADKFMKELPSKTSKEYGLDIIIQADRESMVDHVYAVLRRALHREDAELALRNSAKDFAAVIGSLPYVKRRISTRGSFNMAASDLCSALHLAWPKSRLDAWKVKDGHMQIAVKILKHITGDDEVNADSILVEKFHNDDIDEITKAAIDNVVLGWAKDRDVPFSHWSYPGWIGTHQLGVSLGAVIYAALQKQSNINATRNK